VGKAGFVSPPGPFEENLVDKNGVNHSVLMFDPDTGRAPAGVPAD